MGLHRFQRDQLAATPWKNGGGSTREIACWPPGAGMGNFGWRVSIATIAADGPFSIFGGIDRSIMLLDGDGVRLRSGDGHIDHPLDQPYQPFAFSGDAEIDCRLLGGASSDFNVMTRRGLWRAEVQVLAAATAVEAAPHGLLLAQRGSWRLDDQQPACREGQGLYWTDTPQAWQLEPETPEVPEMSEARMVVVRFIS